MNVRDLKRILSGVDDELIVLIPMNGEFDGHFVSPCLQETDIVQLGIKEDSEETAPAFVIVPCGFFQERHGVDPELN